MNIFVKSENENVKKLISSQEIIWNKNVNNIVNSLNTMNDYINNDKHFEMIKKNNDFMNKYFNEQIYFDSLVKLL